MKKFTVVILSIALLFTLAACGGGAAPSTASGEAAGSTAAVNAGAATDTGGEPTVIKLGYAMSNMDENMQRQLRGMEMAVADYNAENTDTQVDFIYTEAQGNVDKQLADVESLILRECDIILLNSVDSAGCIPAAEAIHNAGIICVEMRGMESDAVDLHYYGIDEYAISTQVKNYLVEQLEADSELVLQVGLIYGNPSHSNNLRRHDAILELAEEMPDRVQIIDSRYGNWSTDEAMSITEDWIQIYPDLNTICSASDDMALGITNALTSAGLIDNFIVTSVDGTKIGEGLVQDGKLDVTIKMLMTSRSYDLLDIALQVFKGEYTENTYNAGAKNVGVVTSANVAEMSQID